MSEKHYVLALEMLTEGSNAKLPRDYVGLFDAVSNHQRQHIKWTSSKGVVGFGVGEKTGQGLLCKPVCTASVCAQKAADRSMQE